MSDPVLTSSYCTNWDAFNTPRLWSMVMNEDDGLAREQVQGWKRLAGSIRGQQQALAAARADLIAAWPPEQNASAEAFLNELDRLMARLEVASTDADTTANGLDKILNALDTAKKSIEPLWEKYKNESDDLVPRWFDSAEDEIDEQARAAMIKMEGAVSDAVADLRVPDPYNFSVGEGPQEWPPKPGTGSGSGSGRLGAGGVSAIVPHDPPPPLPGEDPILPDTPGGAAGSGVVPRPGGPDLAGVINPPATLPAPVGGTSGPVPGGSPPVGIPPVLPGVLPGGGGAAPGAGAGRPPVGGPGRGPGVGRTLPSGAVIGGPGLIGGPGATGGRGIAGRGVTRGRGIGGPGATGGRGVGQPGVGGVGAVGGPGVGGRGAGGPQLGGVGGPGGAAGRGLGGVRGPGGARGRSGRRDGDEAGGVRPGAGDVEAFGSTPAGTTGPIGGPLGGGRISAGGVGGGGAGSVGPGAGRIGGGAGAGRAARAPQPAWLPDDPVGPDRHNVGGGAQRGRDGRFRHGDEPTGFDPDNLWQVTEGVNPVISPDPDDNWHDPGPNVIGRRG